jgi:hypothetical protein
MPAVTALIAAGNDDSLSANFKLCAAAVIDPDSVIVVTPTAILNALGFALLADHLNAAGGVDGTNVAAHVVGRAGHPKCRLGRRRGGNMATFRRNGQR